MTTFDQKRAAELLPIFTALAEGKTIEVRGPDGGWYKFDARADVGLEPEDYRVKPSIHGASFRVAVLSYLDKQPNAQGYLLYAISVTNPDAEAHLERRPNFVRWLGERTELLIGPGR